MSKLGFMPFSFLEREPIHLIKVVRRLGLGSLVSEGANKFPLEVFFGGGGNLRQVTILRPLTPGAFFLCHCQPQECPFVTILSISGQSAWVFYRFYCRMII